MASQRLLLRATPRTIFPVHSSRVSLALTQTRYQRHDAYDEVKNRVVSNLSSQHVISPLAAARVPERPRRQIPWKKLSGRFGVGLTALGGLIIITIAGLCFVYRDEVEGTNRKRFRCLDNAAIAICEFQFSPNGGAAGAMRKLESARNAIPPGILPDDHPQTMIIKRIFEQLVKSSELQELDWEIYVLDAPSEFLKHGLVNLSSVR